MSEINPQVIILPNDDVLVARLRLKLEEYITRIDPFHAPELQLSTHLKIETLETLLNNHTVDTRKLSLELAEKYGEIFDIALFNNTCDIINDYVKTGGKNLKGGTGLPNLSN